MFNMEIGEPPSTQEADGDHNKLENMIKVCSKVM